MPYDDYQPFKVGGIIPERYSHRFSIAHEKLSGRVTDVDSVLLELWNKATNQEKDLRDTWHYFVLLMTDKVKELDNESTRPLGL